MKKIILILISCLIITPIYADKLLKDGFLNSKMSYVKDQNIIDPKNNILPNVLYPICPPWTSQVIAKTISI
jgi:hypothetical protein